LDGIKIPEPGQRQPSQIVMHVRHADAEASLQQKRLGIVESIFATAPFFSRPRVNRVAARQADHRQNRDRLFELSGIEFRNVDNRIMALKLVQLGLSGAAMFWPNREVLQPSDVLQYKAVLVERGSFRPPTHVNLDMLNLRAGKV